VSVSSAEIKTKIGGSERIRYEYFKNHTDLENTSLDNQGFFRFRTQLWGQVDLNEQNSVYLRLTNENRAYTYSAPVKDGRQKKGRVYDINETVIDNLYVDLKDVLDSPLSLRLGRQDLTDYGEGFLILDGTPGDGSRTIYFNAVKGSYKLSDNVSFDMAYLVGQRYDSIFRAINEGTPPNPLNTTDETGAFLYFRTKPTEKIAFEPFYIYKRESDGKGAKGYQAKDSRIHAIGEFSKIDLGFATLRQQLALQFGNYGDDDRKAMGGYMFLDKELKDWDFSPTVSGGYVYLSGDKTETSKNEAWDPMFSRWPWMSELYCITMDSETGVLSYWTNLQMYRTEVKLNLTKKLKLTPTYNYLRANEYPASNSISMDGGKVRGQLPQLKLDYAFTDNIKGYLLAEYFIPGNFYNNAADDALFLRADLTIKF